jgi:hypothetical protein
MQRRLSARTATPGSLPTLQPQCSHGVLSLVTALLCVCMHAVPHNSVNWEAMGQDMVRGSTVAGRRRLRTAMIGSSRRATPTTNATLQL